MSETEFTGAPRRTWGFIILGFVLGVLVDVFIELILQVIGLNYNFLLRAAVTLIVCVIVMFLAVRMILPGTETARARE